MGVIRAPRGDVSHRGIRDGASLATWQMHPGGGTDAVARYNEWVLGLAGLLLLFAGAWAAVSAAVPAAGVFGAGWAAFQAIALAFAIAGWRPAVRDGGSLAALGTSWAATLPGAFLLVALAVRTDAPGAGNILLAINLLWFVVAPYLFVTSALTSPLRGARRSLTLARTAHLGAWLSSSLLALSCWL